MYYLLLMVLIIASNAFPMSMTKLGMASVPQRDEERTESIRRFQEVCTTGLLSFKQGNATECMRQLDIAAKMRLNLPLMQRGIILYLMGRYDDALQQLMADTELIEKMKISKASDLRIWQSACCNKLKLGDYAIRVLDLPGKSNGATIEERYLLNNTLSFFGKDTTLEDMLQIIGSVDENDRLGFRFFGNFYLALYFDSIDDAEMARVFLQFPFGSKRYPKDDMWYHLPRMLAKMRGWEMSEEEESSAGEPGLEHVRWTPPEDDD